MKSGAWSTGVPKPLFQTRLWVFDRQVHTRASCGFEFFRSRAHLVVRMARLDIQKEKDCFLDWVLHRLLPKRQGA